MKFSAVMMSCAKVGFAGFGMCTNTDGTRFSGKESMESNVKFWWLNPNANLSLPMVSARSARIGPKLRADRVYTPSALSNE